MNWKRNIARILHRWRTTDKLLALKDLGKSNNYLQDVGWFASKFSSMAVDGDNRPIPWLTYPSIEFLETRLKEGMHVFEFGSGNSTLWWASRVRRVVSCEHDPNWYGRMLPIMPQNVMYVCRALADGYCDTIVEYKDEFDIVVIDGRQRVECCKRSIAALKPSGVIVWDNSEREKYRPGYDLLVAAGFRRIDFWGIGPIESVQWSTSIFYRSNNCFDI